MRLLVRPMSTAGSKPRACKGCRTRKTKCQYRDDSDVCDGCSKRAEHCSKESDHEGDGPRKMAKRKHDISAAPPGMRRTIQEGSPELGSVFITVEPPMMISDKEAAECLVRFQQDYGSCWSTLKGEDVKFYQENQPELLLVLHALNHESEFYAVEAVGRITTKATRSTPTVQLLQTLHLQLGHHHLPNPQTAFQIMRTITAQQKLDDWDSWPINRTLAETQCRLSTLYLSL